MFSEKKKPEEPGAAQKKGLKALRDKKNAENPPLPADSVIAEPAPDAEPAESQAEVRPAPEKNQEETSAEPELAAPAEAASSESAAP